MNEILFFVLLFFVVSGFLPDYELQELPPVYLEHLIDSKAEDDAWNEKRRDDLRAFGGF